MVSTIQHLQCNENSRYLKSRHPTVIMMNGTSQNIFKFYVHIRETCHEVRDNRKLFTVNENRNTLILVIIYSIR